MTTVLLVNPAAGRGRGARVSAAAIRAARRTWRGVDSVRTTGPGDGVRLAAEVARSGAERLIVVGGDGSVHEAANGLLTSGVADPPPLGVVPVGTGNDFARSLGTRHANPVRAIATLARSQPARWDVGRAGNEYFINSLGIGFDADVAVRVNAQSRLRGFPAYAAAVAQTLARMRPLRVVARWEGGSFSGACLLIELGNCNSTGGGFRLVPSARPDDGKLDLCLVRGIGLRAALARLPFVLLAQHEGLRDVTIARTAFLHVQAPDAAELVVHLEGEVRSCRPAELRVEIDPARLPVLVRDERNA